MDRGSMLNETQRRTLGASVKQLLEFLLKQRLTRLIALAVKPMNELCSEIAVVLLFMHAQADLMQQLSADVKMPSEVRTAWETLQLYATAFATLHQVQSSSASAFFSSSASSSSAVAASTTTKGQEVGLLAWLRAPPQQTMEAVSLFDPSRNCFFVAPDAESGQWYHLGTGDLLKRKPKRAYSHASLRVVGTKQELDDLDASRVSCTRGPNVGIASCLQKTPNYNPSCLLDMAFFTWQVTAAPEFSKSEKSTKQECVLNLVHLRELFLESLNGLRPFEEFATTTTSSLIVSEPARST